MNKLGQASLYMSANVSEEELLDMELLDQLMAGVADAWPRSVLWDWHTYSPAAADVGR